MSEVRDVIPLVPGPDPMGPPDVECPSCWGLFAISPTVLSGRVSCPSCHARLEVDVDADCLGDPPRMVGIVTATVVGDALGPENA